MDKKLLLFTAISYTILLFILTSMPSQNLPENKINDKTAHFCGFCGFFNRLVTCQS